MCVYIHICVHIHIYIYILAISYCLRYHLPTMGQYLFETPTVMFMQQVTGNSTVSYKENQRGRLWRFALINKNNWESFEECRHSTVCLLFYIQHTY